MLLVGNGFMLTFDESMTALADGCVSIDQGVITSVGPTAALEARYPAAAFIDAGGKLILPGFINVHHHIYSALARGLTLSGPPATNFLEVLRGFWWRLDKALTLEDITCSAYVTLLDCVRNGVTTVFDHHAAPNAPRGSLAAIGAVAEELGLRLSLSMEVSDRDGEGIADALIDENLEWLAHCRARNDDRLRGLFGLHASFTLGDRTLARCAESISSSDGFHVHVAEGALDARDSMENHQLQVLERLDKFTVLRPNTIAAHCIAITDQCMGLLRDRGSSVAHNPQSNMNNAVGCARVLEMTRKGVRVGIGTDGYTSDVLESYKVAPILQRHEGKNPSVAFSETAEMLLRGNAAIAAKSFKRPLGVLKEGAHGDVIIVDYDPPTPLTRENQVGHILFGLTGRLVDTAIVGGRVLMRGRRVETVDAAVVTARAREAAKGLWARI